MKIVKVWFTRDLFCNTLALHLSEPYKCKNEWHSPCKNELNDSYLPEGINPQWSDDEPIEVELLVKLAESVE